MLTTGQTVWVPVEDAHDRGNVVIRCCGRRVTVHQAVLEEIGVEEIGVKDAPAAAPGPTPHEDAPGA